MQINLLIATDDRHQHRSGGRPISIMPTGVYQLPLGVIGVAIGVVLLPDMSRKLRADDERRQ